MCPSWFLVFSIASIFIYRLIGDLFAYSRTIICNYLFHFADLSFLKLIVNNECAHRIEISSIIYCDSSVEYYKFYPHVQRHLHIYSLFIFDITFCYLIVTFSSMTFFSFHPNVKDMHDDKLVKEELHLTINCRCSSFF